MTAWLDLCGGEWRSGRPERNVLIASSLPQAPLTLQPLGRLLPAPLGQLGAVAAWPDGQIDLTALIAAVWAAAQTCFIRAGIANEVQKHLVGD